MGRKNYLFAGSDAGARRAAILYTVLRTCARNDVAPLEYLRDVLTRLADGWPQPRIDELLPGTRTSLPVALGCLSSRSFSADAGVRHGGDDERATESSMVAPDGLAPDGERVASGGVRCT